MADEKQESQNTGAPQPTAPPLDEELGLSLHLPFAVPYVDNTSTTNSYEIYRGGLEDEPTVRQLVNMRKRDGQARALYRLITLPIRSALKSKKIVPSSDNGIQEAEFIRDMFMLPPALGGMESNLDNFISQVLMALFDGFSAFELVYHVPSYGPLDGRICLKKASHRPSETIKFLVGANGDFEGFRQQTQFAGKTLDVKIPKERAFYFTAQDEERPYYGVSYFQAAFSHYDKKDKLYYLAHLAAQHRAVGSRIGEVPQGASKKDIAGFRAALSDYGFAQGMIIPQGFRVKNEYPGAVYDFLDIINHHNSQMSKSVLAAFFDQSQGGDKAIVDFGHQSDAMFMMMLQAIMTEISDAINDKLIPQFIDWNFGTGEYPKFTWGAFTDDQKSAITTIFDRLATAGAGVNVTPDFMMQLERKVAEDLNLSIDYGAIEEQRAALLNANDEDSIAFRQFLAESGVPAAQGLGTTTSLETSEDSIGLSHNEMISLTDTIADDTIDIDSIEDED